MIRILAFLLVSVSSFGQTITSPDRRCSLTFTLSASGEPTYQMSINKRPVIKSSKLGIELKDASSLIKGFTVERIDSAAFDENWNPVWGEVKTIRNNYKELAVTLSQKEPARTIVIRFRVFNDGLGFRYEFPDQQNLKHFIVARERTEFGLTGDHKTFWIPGDYDTNEYAYSTTKLSETDALKGNKATEISVRNVIPNTVQTPLMMKSADGLYINIHEAALVNYPAMLLWVDKAAFQLSSHLVGDAVGNKAYLQTPCKTPWRTVTVSDKAVDILSSKIILNLNEPSKIQDTGWIKPAKYIGIWWEMHAGTASWNYSDATNLTLAKTDWAKLKPNGHHGATTLNTKRYIDFAAQHGFTGVLVEGWNVGWEDWFGQWKEEVFDFVTPYPDFDVKELQQYAAGKNVKLIMHHETSGAASNYERRMDEAYRFMKENGYDAVKTGYVGKIIPRGEPHDGQWMVNHYNRVIERTAKNHIMLDAHEPVRPTGLHRTWPNFLACEAARGNEFNAWSGGNPVDHETILPFTRLMGGPMDYTPGIFQIKMDYYDSKKPVPPSTPTVAQVHTTLAKQLALYVTMYSPLQMAADMPENYEKHLDAFQFIKDIAVDWDDTRILEAEPGDYITIVRKAKDRDDWFLGTVTDENARISTVALGFLDPGKNYVASLYLDADNADWKSNPMAYQVQKSIVTGKTQLRLKLAPGGGAAVSLKQATQVESKSLKKYK